MVVNQYSWLLSILKISYAKKKNYVIIRYYSKKMLSLLNLLLDNGYILNFRFYKVNYILIHLKYGGTKPFWSLQIYHAPSFYHNISYKVLHEISGYDKGSIYIIASSVGLVDGLTCLKKKIGGKLVCILYRCSSSSVVER